MLDKVAAHQEKVRWKSQMSTVIAGCQLTKARVLHSDFSDRRNPTFELLIESLSGSWHVHKSICDFQDFSDLLRQTFPVEAGERGHRCVFPPPPSTSTITRLFSSPSKFASRLNRSVEEFCKALLMLPPYISRSKVLLDFFLSSVLCEARSREPSRTNSIMERSSMRSNTFSDPSEDSSVNIYGTCRMKIKHGTECAIILYDPETSFDLVIRQVAQKLQIELDRVLLTYKDETGDLIRVKDNEDLYAAVVLSGKRLVLYIE